MPAVNATAGQSGPRSATFSIPTSNGSDTVSNAQLVAAMSEGPLKDLFTATYADVPAFVAAARAAGFTMAAIGGATLSALNIVASSSTPSLAITAGAVSAVIVKMSVSHSITK